jgi:hypothetical protein
MTKPAVGTSPFGQQTSPLPLKVSDKIKSRAESAIDKAALEPKPIAPKKASSKKVGKYLWLEPEVVEAMEAKKRDIGIDFTFQVNTALKEYLGL